MSDSQGSPLSEPVPIQEFGGQSVVAKQLLNDAGKAQVEELLIYSLVSKAAAQGYQRHGDYASVQWLDGRDQYPSPDIPDNAMIARAVIRVIPNGASPT